MEEIKRIILYFVNVRPKHYEGKAGRLSMFSILAKRIGNIKDTAVMECNLD